MRYYIPKIDKKVPFITTQQMIEVDRLMIEEYNINLFQMMENAGRCLAICVREEAKYNVGMRILIIVGAGGNGGGGMTAARRLYNWGYSVDVLITAKEDKFKGVMQSQLKILKNIGIGIIEENDFDFTCQYDIIVDAMIGYSLKGELRENIVRLINFVNSGQSLVVALDVPSGLDSTTGDMMPVCINADLTMTLALPKVGFIHRQKEIGKLLLADISVPPILYRRGFGMEVGNIFKESDIVEIDFDKQ